MKVGSTTETHREEVKEREFRPLWVFFWSSDWMSFSQCVSVPPASPRHAYVLVLTQEQVLEGVLEGGVAQGVAGRVDGAVDVAEPVADGPQRVWDAGGAKGVDQHHHVVRRPGDHEGHQDGHDGARDLLLPGGDALLFPHGHCILLCHLGNQRLSHHPAVVIHI